MYVAAEWLRKQAQSNVWEFPCRWGGVVEQRSFLSGQDRKNVADGLLSRLMHATASSSISHDGIDLRSEVEKQASSATELAGIAVTLSDVETERKKKERGPMVAYHESLESGKLRRDERQMHTVMELERVYMDLLKQHGSAKKDSSGLTLVEASTGKRRKGWWSSMFLQDNSNCETVAGVKGLYMFGGVGCGKTMLMDMFAHSVPSYISVCVCVRARIYTSKMIFDIFYDACCRWSDFIFMISCLRCMSYYKNTKVLKIRSTRLQEIFLPSQNCCAWMKSL